jgi:hypothetical protein
MTLPNDAPERGPDEGPGVVPPASDEAFRYLPFELKLREWNLSYELVPEFKIDSIRRDPTVQIRSAVHIAPKERVEEYAQQMRNGAQFPPILIYAPNTLIDGNTRVAAATRVGRKTFPALVVNARRPEMAKILAASINQMGGERLTVEDAHDACQLMMQEGYLDAAIARELGRDMTQVRRWRQQRDVEEHAARLDIKVERIPATALRTLAPLTHDEPFAELTKLFADVRPFAKDAKTMVAEVMQAPSDTEALAVVARMREELAPEGPPPHKENRNQEANLARAAIGNLLKFDGRPLAAFDPAKREDDLGRWTRLAGVVQQVLTALRGDVA